MDKENKKHEDRVKEDRDKGTRNRVRELEGGEHYRAMNMRAVHKMTESYISRHWPKNELVKS